MRWEEELAEWERCKATKQYLAELEAEILRTTDKWLLDDESEEHPEFRRGMARGLLLAKEIITTDHLMDPQKGENYESRIFAR